MLLTGAITAQEALREALLNIKEVCAHMKSTFEDAVAGKKAEDGDPMQE